MEDSTPGSIFVLRSAGTGETITVRPGDALVVGRTEESDVPLLHESVSRGHARLTHAGSGLRVEDLGSANGTFCNGEPCEERVVDPGDRVGFGALEFTVEVLGEDASAPWEEGVEEGTEPESEAEPEPQPRPEAPGSSEIEDRSPEAASRDRAPSDDGADRDAPDRKWWLNDPERKEPITIPVGATLVVGRTGEADITLPHPKTSRRHAKVTGADTGLLIEDLGSTNGTFVEGERVETASVAPGDRVRFGSVELVVGRDEGTDSEGSEEGEVPAEDEVLDPSPGSESAASEVAGEPVEPSRPPISPEGKPLELLIIGTGPAGLAAAAHASANDMRYLVLERSDHLADTVHRYQKGKHVMAQPSEIPLRGALPFEAGARESILEGWQAHAEERGLDVRLQQEVVGIERQNGTLTAWTSTDAFRAEKVILAIGTQGNPRRLGVPGQDLPHVSNRLVDPDLHENESLVVVGAGDSALEVALALCERNHVFLVVRKPEIARAKESLTRAALKRESTGELEILYSTNVEEVVPGGIRLEGPQEMIELEADEIFVKIGTLPPRRFLESLGVEFPSEDREARPELSGIYESSVPGLHLIGATTGRDLIKFAMNQGYEVVEHLLGREVKPADEEVLRSRLPFYEGSARERILRLMDAVPLVGAAAGEPGPGFEKRRASAAEQLRELLLGVEPRRFEPDEVIVRQNDYTNSVLIVVRGRVEIRRTDEQGRERRVAILEPGDFFGEMALISGRRRNATVIALESVEILEVPRKAILRLIYSSHAVRETIDAAFLVRAFQNYLPPEIPVEEIWDLTERAELMEVDREEVIYRQGDPGDAIYLLRSGQVKVTKASGNRELVVCYLTAGNVFGEGALVTGDARPVTVTSIFPSTLIRLRRETFLQFLGRYPGLKPSVIEKLEAERVERLREEATPGAGRLLDELIREEVVMGTDALIIDEYKCVRCDNCIRACEDVHDDGQARLSLTGIVFANILAPNSCWQCENPLCMLDCPPDALYRDARGEIRIRDNCIGCGNCEENCPYDNIFMVHPEPKFSLTEWVRKIFTAGDSGEASDRTVAVKCDLCSDLHGGPACVRSCPTGAAIRVRPEEYQDVIGDLLVSTRHG